MILSIENRLKEVIHEVAFTSHNLPKQMLASFPALTKTAIASRQYFCYSCPIMRGLYIEIKDETRNQLEKIAITAGKPERIVADELVERGVKSYQQFTPSPAKVLLEIADYAEKIGAKGPTDLSIHHDRYQWEA